jgi:drug/metabolite transporter (DMT)-like permease
MKNEAKGILLALAAAVVSGISIPANKFFIVSLDPSVFTAVRSVIIGFGFLIIAEYQARSQHRRFRKAPWSYLLGIAAIGGSAAFLLYFTGLQLTTAGRAALLYHSILTASTVILAFVFLGERLGKRMSIALVVMLAGTVLLYMSQIPASQLWPDPSLGDLLIMAASVFWGIEYVISKKAMSMGETNFVVTFARMFFGGIMLFGVVIVMGDTGALLSLSAQQWTNILASTALLFADVLFWYWSIRYINVSKAAILLLVAPIVSLLGSIFMLGEPAPPIQIAGSAIILLGSYFVIGVRNGPSEKNR